jgi:hypothetical protein
MRSAHGVVCVISVRTGGGVWIWHLCDVARCPPGVRNGRTTGPLTRQTSEPRSVEALRRLHLSDDELHSCLSATPMHQGGRR